MSTRYFISLLLICIFSYSQVAFATNNAGFVEGLWYSQETFFENQSIRLYVAIRNNTGAELSGTVTFYDNNTVITKKAVNALDERIVESWADWTPSYGEHTVRAELSRLELSTAGGNTIKTTVSSSLAEDIIFVDKDTDGDGVGDETDPDIDGDGHSNEAEIADGTDPTVYNEPVVETADDADATDRTSEEGDEEDSVAAALASSSFASVGLERYLTPSRADTLLSSITTLTEEAKTKIDSYREKRNLQKAIASNDPELTVNSDGFGEIIRSTDKIKTTTPDGFMGDFINFVATILSGIMTGILASLSFGLSYPVLIQLLILLGTLYLLYRITRHFGQRSSGN